jgi:fructosamine-3-kinase
MRPEEIPAHHITPNIPKTTQEMRDQIRERYFAPTIELLYNSSVFKNVRNIDDMPKECIKELDGGYNGATWLVGVPGEEIVLKFQRRGCDEEAEWLNAYAKNGVNVPKIKAIGTAPNQTGENSLIKFLALEAITGEDNQRAKTARELELDIPVSNEISKVMGLELAKIHQCTTNKKFGDYSDIDKNNQTVGTWQEYLQQYLTPDYTSPFNINENERFQLLDKLNTIDFPEKGVYLHGDFAFHNVLVKSLKPVDIVIIDPNLVIGDPYFDLAKQYDFQELKTSKRKAFSGDSKYVSEWWEQSPINIEILLDSYFKETGMSKIDPVRLAANQLVTKMQAFNNRLKFMAGRRSEGHAESIALEMKVRKDLIREKVDYLLK